MDLTSTSSLVLFPTTPTQLSHDQNTEQYHELARLASSWHLPQSQRQYHPQIQHVQRPKTPQHHQPHCQLPSQRVAAITAQADVQARRRAEKEELRRLQITSFRSKDGLLSPPPLPNYVRRKKKSITNLNPRAMESSPELTSPDTSDSESIYSAPGTPPPYGTRSYAASAVDLRVCIERDAVGLGISSSPRSAPLLTRSQTSSPKRPSPFRNNTMDDALLGVGLIQPPSPSLLRPKSFWKNHPRSALTSLAYSPCSQVVRRSTFIAAGMNIDQGAWDGNFSDSGYSSGSPSSSNPQSPERPPPVPRKDSMDKENVNPSSYDSDTDPEEEKQNEAVRAFGRSLWNASTLALAVESRTRSVNNSAGAVVCVPGVF